MGMDLYDASNGIFLPKKTEDISSLSKHSGYHSVYNEFVEIQLDAIDITHNNIQLQMQVLNLQNALKRLQQNGLPLYPS